MPVGHPGSWVVPSDIASRVVLNPKTKRQSGRPMEGRYASSSERTTTQSCRRCGQPGHNSRRCSNPPMVNEGPSTIVPEEYRRKCSICHKIRHNKQTCPDRDCPVEWMQPYLQDEDELPPLVLMFYVELIWLILCSNFVCYSVYVYPSFVYGFQCIKCVERLTANSFICLISIFFLPHLL